jgi:putative glutamine amidotransferase
MGSAGISEYERAVEQAGGEPHRLSADADRVLRDIGEYDGFVISGGDDVAPSRYGAPLEPETQTAPAERDEYEIALVRAAFERRLPTLAICRGLQVANVAFGGTLHQHVPNTFGDAVPHRVRSNDGTTFRGLIEDHVVEVEPDSRLAGLVGRKLVTGSRHHQAVDRVGASLRVVARSKDGLIEALEPNDRGWFWLGVQWHPESTLQADAGASLALFRALVSAPPPARHRPRT